LLLSIPDALNKATLLLERLLPLIMPNGRLGTKPANPAATIRLNSVKASMMEAFSWLPPGSYPMAADQLFFMAANLIKEATEAEVPSSLLPCLVSYEDRILDTHSLLRATEIEHVRGATDLQESIVVLTSEPANHNEREAVLHSLPWKQGTDSKNTNLNNKNGTLIANSPILGYTSSQESLASPPTPLHEVGTWRKPFTASQSSKIRLLDSAIHAFAATFGLQDGQEQERAMFMLQSLLPLSLVEPATRAMEIKSALMSESERRIKTKQEHAISSNIVGTIIACLKALPLHLGTHDVDIGMGPPWMKLAKDIFLVLIAFPTTLIRRASAEGLARLATCGVSEDALSLQSSIFTTLEQLVSGVYNTQQQSRKVSQETIAFQKSSALLTIGCLQRLAYEHHKNNESDKFPRSRMNHRSKLPIPTKRMVSSVIASLANVGHANLEHESSAIVRICALHSFALLISYFDANQTRSEDSKIELERDRVRLLHQAVDILEDAFMSVWTAVSADLDRGHEVERFSTEPSLLSVLIRLATSLVPYLDLIQESDSSILNRFGAMIPSLIELSDRHPSVVIEGIAFFERLAKNHRIFSSQPKNILPESGTYSFVSFFSQVLAMDRISLLPGTGTVQNSTCYGSIECQWGAVMCLRIVVQQARDLDLSQVSTRDLALSNIGLLNNNDLRAQLFAFTELLCGARYYQHASIFRSVAASRLAKPMVLFEDVKTEASIALQSLLFLEGQIRGETKLLDWLLCARSLITGAVDKYDNESADDTPTPNDTETVSSVVRNASRAAGADTLIVTKQVGPSRWQVKLEAATVGLLALTDLAKRGDREIRNNAHPQKNITWQQLPQFNPIAGRAACAKKCREVNATPEPNSKPNSYVSLHLEGLISATCTAATATSDQAELPSLQNIAVQMLALLVWCFGDALDPDFTSSSIGGKSDAPLVLNQFSSQIVSSVRHALGSSTSSITIQALFASGCEALLLLLKKGLVVDPAVVRRSVRPVVPTELKLPFGSFPKCQRDITNIDLRPPALSKTANIRSLLFYRVAQLGTFAKLKTFTDIGILDQSVSNVLEKFHVVEDGLAVHAAALAIDAARCNQEERSGATDIDEETKGQKDTPSKVLSKGLTFANIDDMDSFTKKALAEMWPALAAYAVTRLTQDGDAASVGDGTTINQKKKEWLGKLSPTLFVGLNESLDVIARGFMSDNWTWSFDKSPDATALLCVYGIRNLLKGGLQFHVESTTLSVSTELNLVIQKLLTMILLPSLRVTMNQNNADINRNKFSLSSSSHKPSRELTLQSCKLMEDMCSSHLDCNFNFSGQALLKVVLSPLAAFQEGAVTWQNDNDAASTVLASCLRSVQHLITSKRLAEDGISNLGDIIRSIIAVSLMVRSTEIKGQDAPCQVKEAASNLLCVCLRDPSITSIEKQAIAKKIAQAGDWEEWRKVCSQLEDGSGLRSSLDAIEQAITDNDNHLRQMNVLIAIRNALQDHSLKTAKFGFVMHSVGAQVLNTLKKHGLYLVGNVDSQVRVSIIADSIRISMLAFQHLMTENHAREDGTGSLNDVLASYLRVIFAILVPVIDFNGLPNNIKKTIGSDPAIGKLCAQTIVHIARGSAPAFKCSMGSMTAEERSILEMAMRAELTGYPVANSSGLRKIASHGKRGKLNIKAFKS